MQQNSTKKLSKKTTALRIVIHGKSARQDAFIKAYLASAFNISSACRQIAIDRSTFYKWLEEPDFARQLNEAKESKKDFIESMLLEKVAKGDTIAIIFACKCLLADRGYVERNHTHVTAEAKPFSKEERDAVVNAFVTAHEFSKKVDGSLLEYKPRSEHEDPEGGHSA
jgi:hypothetical protein